MMKPTQSSSRKRKEVDGLEENLRAAKKKKIQEPSQVELIVREAQDDMVDASKSNKSNASKTVSNGGPPKA